MNGLVNSEDCSKYDSFPHGAPDDAEHVEWGKYESNNPRIPLNRVF